MTLDLPALRKIAKAATQSETDWLADVKATDDRRLEDRAYIEAISPDRMIQIIDELIAWREGRIK